MPKNTKKIAQETRDLRLKVYLLQQQGMTESEALVEVLPSDTNRSRRMNLWKRKGLYPPPERSGHTEGETGHTEPTSEYETGHAYRAVGYDMSHTTLENILYAPEFKQAVYDLIRSYQESAMSHTEELVDQKLAGLLSEIKVEPVQRPGRGGSPQTVKKTFSIPTDVWKSLNNLGGIASNHVTAALRLYLKTMD